MWDHSKVNSSFTYESFDGNARSTIDHIICSPDLYSSIVGGYAIHDLDNLSNHNVIVVNFKYALNLTSRHLTSFPADSTSWKRAKDYDVAYYMKCLDKQLQSICVPTNVLYCSNNFCKLSEHRMVLDNSLCNILKCIIDAE